MRKTRVFVPALSLLLASCGSAQSANTASESSSAPTSTTAAPATSSSAPITFRVAELEKAAEIAAAHGMDRERFDAIEGYTYEQFMELASQDDRIIWATAVIESEADDVLSRIRSARAGRGQQTPTTPFVEATLDMQEDELLTRFLTTWGVVTFQIDPTTYTFDTERAKKLASGWMRDDLGPYSLIGSVPFNRTRVIPMLDADQKLVSNRYSIIYASGNGPQPDGTTRRQLTLEGDPANLDGAPFLDITFEYHEINGKGTWLVIFWTEYEERPDGEPGFWPGDSGN